MEQHFRIALWMFLLSGYLQAIPVHKREASFIELGDLGHLSAINVSCETNATFTSPKDVEAKCYGKALKHFKEQLEYAQEKCPKNKADIIMSVEALQTQWKTMDQAAANCTFNLATHVKFANFLDATKGFVQEFNDHQDRKKNP